MKTTFLIVLLLISLVLVGFYGEHDVEYIRLSWAAMLTCLLVVVFIVIALYKLIQSGEEEDLFLSHDFWFSIGLLTYFFFSLYNKIFSNFANFKYAPLIGLAVLLFGNAITSLFLIIGFKQWAKNLS